MGANDNDVTFRVKAVDAASGTFQKVADNAKKANEGLLKGLKGGLGEESKFGAVAKILSGAGAVAGLSLAGNELNKFADKFAELRKMARDGAGTGEIAEKLAISIPIFGGLIEAGRKFRAEMDGSAEALERINNSTEAINAAADAARAGMERRRQDQVSGLEATLKKLEDERKAATMGEEDKAVFIRQTQLEDAKKKANDDLEAYRKQVLQANQPVRNALNNELGTATQAVRSARDDLDDTDSVSFKARFPLSGDKEKAKRQSAYNEALTQLQDASARHLSLVTSENKEIANRKASTDKIIVDLEAQAQDDIKQIKQASRDEEERGRTAWLAAESSALNEWVVMHKENAERVADILADTRSETLKNMGLEIEAQIVDLNRAHAKAVEKIRIDAAAKIGLSGGNPIAAGMAKADAEMEIRAMEAQRAERENAMQEAIRKRNGIGALSFISPLLSGSLGIGSGAIDAYLENIKSKMNPLPGLASQSAADAGVGSGIGRALRERQIAGVKDEGLETLKKIQEQGEEVKRMFSQLTDYLKSFGGKFGPAGSVSQ